VKGVFWSSTASSLLVGPILSLLCLRQWGSNHPWSRLDFYAATFLVLGIVLGFEEAITFARTAYRSKEVAREAFGFGYEPHLFYWGMGLNAALLLVILDYAHWHLVPVLEKPLLQGCGLVLGVFGVVWQAWADSWLGHHFAGKLAMRSPMTGGPFRLVRHPRYAGFLLRKLAWPLLFASVIGWALFPPWLVLVFRRMRLEEAHMTEVFGSDYIAYARRTARLLPGLY
jgi:protein-S-isoprenylcysteine O-methyltransferase Ste14